LVGVFFLSAKGRILQRYVFLFVSLAAGALLGDAFIHLIPESFEAAAALPVSLIIVAGIVVFFILEKFLHWHHHENDVEERHIHPVGRLAILSDSVHNFLDGGAIGISFLISVPVGIATTLAIALHEIPQEAGDFAVLLHAGYSRAKALWLNFASALTAILGTLAAFALGQAGEGLLNWILPLAAGGFIYIAVADLIPELHKTTKASRSFLQLVFLVLGILAMTALAFLE
jgi:zinc and cadmium transporter